MNVSECLQLGDDLVVGSGGAYVCLTYQLSSRYEILGCEFLLSPRTAQGHAKCDMNWPQTRVIGQVLDKSRELLLAVHYQFETTVCLSRWRQI